jgi:hypothetical protein
MSFGRHQSFYLKKHWITKGLNSLRNIGFEAIIRQDSFKFMGIGKNMLQSLRFWMEASYIVNLVDRSHSLTLLGSLIDHNDLGCNENITKLLIHYFLVIEDERKTDSFNTFIWFFNNYEEDFFSKDNLIEAIVKYDKGNTSRNTLNRDIDCLLNTYLNSKQSHPEDINVSLLSDLRLISRNESGTYKKTSLAKEKYSLDAFYYILLRLNEINSSISIDDLVNSKFGFGKTFNMNRIDVIDVLEKMIQVKKYDLDITRTNNIDTISIRGNTNSDEYLRNVFGELTK